MPNKWLFVLPLMLLRTTGVRSVKAGNIVAAGDYSPTGEFYAEAGGPWGKRPGRS